MGSQELQTIDKTTTAEHCQKICQQLQGCTHFTWLTHQYRTTDGVTSSEAGKCILRPDGTGIQIEPGKVSGPKYCSENDKASTPISEITGKLHVTCNMSCFHVINKVVRSFRFKH